jgi:hypothetical protein
MDAGVVDDLVVIFRLDLSFSLYFSLLFRKLFLETKEIMPERQGHNGKFPVGHYNAVLTGDGPTTCLTVAVFLHHDKLLGAEQANRDHHPSAPRSTK